MNKIFYTSLSLMIGVPIMAASAQEEYDFWRAHFDTAMEHCIHKRHSFSRDDIECYKLFSHLFSLNAPLLASPDTKIPKKIHQIWIGSEPPADLLELAETVRRCNPDFEYKLWRDSDLQEFNLQNDHAFRVAPNWGEKADIFRYRILEKYGGFYLDMDFVCLKSLEPLRHGVNFVIGIPNVCGGIEVANGFIGCTPNHPIIRETLSHIIPADSYEGRRLDTLMRSGPKCLTRVLRSLANSGLMEGILVLPVTYNYPLPNTYHGEQRHDVYARYLTEESYCIHLWQVRWIKPGGLRN